MSDGFADMMSDVKESVENYLEALVRHYENAAFEQRNIGPDEAVSHEIRLCADKVRGMPQTVLADHLELTNYERFMLYLAGPFPGLEDLFFLLFRSGKIPKLIRLQRATEYCGRLLVFTDSKWRLADNGVHYQSPSKMVDGEPDVLLGFAKQRASGRLYGDFNRHLPLLIVGNKSYARKNWKLGRIFQPNF